jgi:hypothetical protein
MREEVPDEIGRVKISDPLPIEDRDFAAAQLVLNHTVEDPDVVYRGNVLKMALIYMSLLLRLSGGYPPVT